MMFEAKQDIDGFSLIEIAIALAIISILVSFSLPVFNKYKTYAKVVEVSEALATIRTHMESFYQEHQSYVNNSPTASSSICGAVELSALDAQYFNFTCLAVAENEFLWEASNKENVGLGAAQTYKYTINQDGEQTTTAHPDASGTMSCWLLRKNIC